MVNVVTTPEEWHDICSKLEGSLGFVPTMGNLHAGHLKLVEQALNDNDNVVVSIFVNHTQFNDDSDYEKYARTLKEDCAKLAEFGSVYVFAPDKDVIYPHNYEVQVLETSLSNEVEGEFREGHFTGMLTVVLKLLNIIGADKAYFGKKDFQQLMLVKKMVEALFIPTKIIACPIIREDSGLAMSSRNNRLTKEEKKIAPLLYKYLQNAKMTDDEVKKALEKKGFKPEYVATKWGRRLVAAWLGDVRLIDNVVMEKKVVDNAIMS